jgi:hypothetical protein
LPAVGQMGREHAPMHNHPTIIDVEPNRTHELDHA